MMRNVELASPKEIKIRVGRFFSRCPLVVKLDAPLIEKPICEYVEVVLYTQNHALKPSLHYPGSAVSLSLSYSRES